MRPGEQETARLRAAFVAGVGDNATPTEGDVNADEMWDVVVGDVTGAEARAIIERVVRSPHALVEWRMTVALVREAGLKVVVAAPDVEEAEDSTREAPGDELAARRRRSRAALIGWVGASLAAAAIAFLVLRPTHEQDKVDPRYRVMPRQSIRSLVPPAPIARNTDLVLRWSGGPPDAHFDVRVTDSRLRVVDSAFNLDRSSYTVPAARLADVPEDVLYWRVVATAANGERIESQTFQLRIDR